MQGYWTRRENLRKDIEINSLYHEKMAGRSVRYIKRINLLNALLSSAVLGLAIDLLNVFEQFGWWQVATTDVIKQVSTAIIAFLLCLVNIISSSRNWQDSFEFNTTMKNRFIRLKSNLSELTKEHVDDKNNEKQVKAELVKISNAMNDIHLQQSSDKDEKLLCLCSYEVRERENFPIPDKLIDKINSFKMKNRLKKMVSNVF